MAAMQRTYSFRARDAAGGLVSGALVASSADEVARRLRADGKFVLHVGDGPAAPAQAVDASEIRHAEAAKRVKRDDVIAFAQQIGVMTETGVPLAEALQAFRQQTRSTDFGVILDLLIQDIENGDSLSNAMSRWPKTFPPIMVSLMKASEASGTMSRMLTRVASYLAKERRTVRQIKGALSYPIFMMLIGIVITVFLMAYVLPRFARIYEQRSASLPLPTRFLLAVSDFIITQAHVYVPVLAGVLVAWLIWRKRPSGRRAVDWLRLNVPILRRLFGQLYLTRASRTMATLLAAGVNLLDIINICRGVTANVYWNDLWQRMDEMVRNGRQLSDAMSGTTVVPPNVVSMVAAGERAGRLAEVMERIAEFSDDELDAAVRQTTTFIEPVMICVMGAVVGGVAIALLLPIFTIGNVMAGS
jgi:type IV pilus assembly protein PilC